MDIILHADDFGRSLGVNDTILEAFDTGGVQSVSVLVNGAGYAKALAEWRKRPNLKLSLHFNLTEGKAISSPEDISTLADSDGYFKHSPLTLARSYYFAGNKKKEVIRAHIRREFEAQLKTLLHDIGNGWRVRVDSHNHIHMLPFVLDEITDVLKGHDVEQMRLVREPLYLSGRMLNPRNVLRDIAGHMRVVLMNTLALFDGAILERKRIPYNTSFVGLFATGEMNDSVARNAFAALGNRPGTAEILFHPGGAAEGEEGLWQKEHDAFRQWYFSPDRANERSVLLSPEFQVLVQSYRSGSYELSTFSEKASSHLGQVVRFGVTGALAATVHLTGLYVFTEFVGMWYVASSAVGFGLGFIVSFSLQKFWTFEDSETDGMHGQAFKYFFLQVFGLTTNLVGIYVLVDIFGMWYMFSQFIILIVVAAVVFLVSKFFIFNSSLARVRA